MRGALQPSTHDQDNRSMRIRIGDAALNSQTDATSHLRLPPAIGRTASPDSVLLDDILDEDMQIHDRQDEAQLPQPHGSSMAASDGSRGMSNYETAKLSKPAGDKSQEAIRAGKSPVGRQRGDLSKRPRNAATETPRSQEVRLEATTYGNHQFVGSKLLHSLDNVLSSDGVDGMPEEGSHQSEETPAPAHRAVHESGAGHQSERPDQIRGKQNFEARNDITCRQLTIVREKNSAHPTTTPSVSADITNQRRGVQPAGQSGKRDIGTVHSLSRSVWDVPSTPPRTHATLSRHRLEERAASYTGPKLTANAHAIPANTQQPSKQKSEDDPDAAWKAFVFGNVADSDNSSDEDEPTRSKHTIDQPKHKQGSTLTTAATAGTSSLLTTSSGVGPPSSTLR